MLSDARILLVIGGGIAAFKAIDLIRRLREAGASVTPVTTRAAEAFVTPLSLSALAGSKVHRDLFDLTAEAEMGHIELSRAADLVCVVPATANLMAKMAAGLADDLASTVLMATDKRVLIAPAMNVRMWEHPATRRNLARLQADGVLVCGPDEGVMACGEFGPGRLAEVPRIVEAIEAALAGRDPAQAGPRAPLAAQAQRPQARTAAPGGAGSPGDEHGMLGPPDESASSGPPTGARPGAEREAPRPRPPGHASRAAPEPRPLAGRRVIVTSGPTHEPIDPVRYIANRSSGAQGAAIASALAERGAEVVFVTGPAAVPPPDGVEVRRVETAVEMRDAVLAALPADAFVAAAAVADWQVEAQGSKLKKGPDGPPRLALRETPDVLALVARHARRPRLVVGFAAETDDLLRHATEKRARKGCDWILANDVSPGTGIMGGPENAVTLVTADGAEPWPRMPKAEVAARLARRIADALSGGVGQGSEAAVAGPRHSAPGPETVDGAAASPQGALSPGAPPDDAASKAPSPLDGGREPGPPWGGPHDAPSGLDALPADPLSQGPLHGVAHLGGGAADDPVAPAPPPEDVPSGEARAPGDPSSQTAPSRRAGGLSAGFRSALIWHMDRHDTRLCDLAGATGVAREAIEGLRGHGDASMSAEDAVLLARYYGCSLDAFLRHGPARPASPAPPGLPADASSEGPGEASLEGRGEASLDGLSPVRLDGLGEAASIQGEAADPDLAAGAVAAPREAVPASDPADG